jgi:hypothetical protein
MWAVFTVIRNKLRAELWDIDPAKDPNREFGPIAQTGAVTLTGADAAKFGKGVSGGVGLYLQSDGGDRTIRWDDFVVQDLTNVAT